MSTQHTPAPWTIERYGDGDSLVINHDTMSRVCFMATPGSNGDPAIIEANAHLIAAAPELLRVAQRCLAMVEEGDGPPNWDWIREVIAKATTP